MYFSTGTLITNMSEIEGCELVTTDREPDPKELYEMFSDRLRRGERIVTFRVDTIEILDEDFYERSYTPPSLRRESA